MEAFDSYVSDPDNPVPYTKRPVMGFWQGLGHFLQGAGRLWKVEDQRFVHLRPDVLSWETGPLDNDLEVVGRIKAFLYASTTGTDSDWIVKLIDVYPEDYPEKPVMGGYQLMITDDVLRGKFRESFENPKPITPNRVTEFIIDLYSRNHCFRKGHKIMVQVQSTWFPLIDRNPQTFLDIPNAKREDYKKATQRVFYSKTFPSHIKISVIPGDELR
jgi:putative CocE/NonD family hydrolase